jgi:hypothetical protein
MVLGDKRNAIPYFYKGIHYLHDALLCLALLTYRLDEVYSKMQIAP